MQILFHIFISKWGEFFIGNYILRHLLHSSVIKALSRGFSNSLKMCGLVDPVPLTLDLLNTKSIGFDRLSRTTTVPSFKSF